MDNYKMFFLLNELKNQSRCKDKQVACVITDIDGEEIVSVGVNNVLSCADCTNPNRCTADVCCVIHAEAMAIQNLNKDTQGPLRAYVSLYPCASCQKTLDPFVDEIIVFGKQHKDCVINPAKIKLVPNLAEDLLNANGEQKQLAVIISELAEEVKAIADYFYRSGERGTHIEELLDEVVDVKLMNTVLLQLIKDNYDNTVYSKLRVIEDKKLGVVSHALSSGKIKNGSPYDKSLPGKDL